MRNYLLAAATIAAWAGCQTPHMPEYGARYHPSNVEAVEPLPAQIRRVALLPIARRPGMKAHAEFATEQLAPILEAELRKKAAFEIVTVTPEQVASWSGQSAWRADDALPVHFLARVRERTGCDAVLFATLNTYRPYPPLAIGWDLRLVDCVQQRTWWAVDELLDAGDGPVLRSAHDYSREHLRSRIDDDETILQSPSRFAQLAIAELVSTLPAR